MKEVSILYTEGKGKFEEGKITIPDLKPYQIRVKSKMTGVCRSDIDMMNGKFGPLPLEMQGHEGLGEVLACGKDVKDVQEGDFHTTFVFEDLDTSQEGWLETLESELI